MCGICGIIGQIHDRDKIVSNMMKKIRHRGPDHSGTFADENATLGFQRLSIVDLDNGQQPMYNEDGSNVIVFNGEIYNYVSLREELSRKSHQFSNQSDTEVLIHGYEEYGSELPKLLRGMFAFAIWDSTEKRLFAARDFFGIKPFYYALIDGAFVFASEIKSILEFPGYSKEVNTDALEQYLSFQYSPLRETFFKGIYKLEPGSYLIYQGGELVIKEYVDWNFAPDDSLSEEAAIKKIDEVLQDSIQAHLTGDVEIASLLSGGVDSSYIAANSGCRKTFTVGFTEDNGKYSEISYAKEFAEKMNMTNYSREISSEDFFSALPVVLYHLDEPVADASAVALYFVNQEASKHVKVLLSGEGADELMGGYNIYNESVDLAWFKFLPAPICSAIGKLARRLPNIKGKNYLIRGSKPLEARYIGNANIFSKEEKNRILKHPNGDMSPQSVTRNFYDKVSGLDDFSKMQYIDVRLWLVGDILAKADKMSMAHSMELRVPFLDKEVFEIASQLPLSSKSKNHTTKYAFRKAAESSIPLSTANKRKLGFPVPIRVWLKLDKYYNMVKTAFTGAPAREYFVTNELLSLLDAHKSGEADNSRKIWTIYTFLVWHNINFAQTPLVE